MPEEIPDNDYPFHWSKDVSSLFSGDAFSLKKNIMKKRVNVWCRVQILLKGKFLEIFLLLNDNNKLWRQMPTAMSYSYTRSPNKYIAA